MATALVIPITTLACMVLVGVVGPGAIAMGVLTALLVLLLHRSSSLRKCT